MKVEISDNKFFEVIRENFLSIQICSNVAPDEMPKFEDEIEKKMPECGTSGGWKFVTYEGDYKDLKPVKCDNAEGCYHYVLMC